MRSKTSLSTLSPVTPPAPPSCPVSSGCCMEDSSNPPVPSHPPSLDRKTLVGGDHHPRGKGVNKIPRTDRSAPARTLVLAGVLLWTIVGAAGCGTNDPSPDRAEQVLEKYERLERELEEEQKADQRKLHRLNERLRNRAREWKTLWCQATVGMTKRDLRDLMGPPTTSLGEADLWDGYGVSVMALYDTELRAYSLDAVSGVTC
jgi:hypothetical protein